MRRIFNVAEKPSVARNITEILSNGKSTKEFTNSRMNPVFSFTYHIDGEVSKMYFTSVKGHLSSLEFDPSYSNWNRTPIHELFTAPTYQIIIKDCKDIEKNIQYYAKLCDKMILWLDCDREGEAIAFEVIEVFRGVQKSSNIKRAVFSAVTRSDIEQACCNLREPDINLAKAVETRQEIDLRIGSAMTRFMTLKYKHFLNTKSNVLSYGPCQLPTLGFVVDRFKRIENFVREEYWSINVEVVLEETPVSFLWDRVRLFDGQAVLTLYEVCLENPLAFVTRINKRQTKKYPPLPLDTVEMNKTVCKYLKISSSQCMQLAESLYSKGFISYPRTETNIFPQSIDLMSLINSLSNHPTFGEYAKRLVDGDFCVPVMGKKNDEAHPPIHPVKSMTSSEAESPLHWQLYEYITRRFLACCSKAAVGDESMIFLDVSGEGFHTKGMVIREYNWLDIYTYEKWEGRIVPNFSQGQEITPTKITLKNGKTNPPALLSEANLIDLMNKNGIGTDATMHEHIQKIQDRHYAVKNEKLRFIPTNLGKALYNAFKEYTASSIDLTKPALRAHMERDMSDIACGLKNKEDVVRVYADLMRDIYLEIANQPDYFNDAMSMLCDIEPDDAPPPMCSFQ
ncbi:DNA topoisomerase III, putative [Theileria equi strain WA]|uniref:DNA topoisomerase n=1 Tax=Theileria equi strain WA TaxID=1537102 RepID=L1LDB1_THEEQ|nr:DNA topoisomerase III, putative [Theileria equi strain WA]EKX73240.1 DNA topoisomerase III, putative [Theileria equi strain WA]|eukprot:XP_004832692.1 DNA topoisomerase III, putative [Theileria equi strain WA]